MTRPVLLLIVLLLCSCATTPVSSVTAIAVPEARILGKSYLAPDAQRTELVTVTRDSGLMGRGVQMIFKVNANPIAALKAGETVALYLAPGKYMFVAEGKPNMFNEPPGESEVEIAATQMNKFRLRLVPGDGPRFEKTIQP